MHRLSARARRILEISGVVTAAGLLALISAIPANATPGRQPGTGGGYPGRGYTQSATMPNFINPAGVRTPVRAAASASVNIVDFNFSPNSVTVNLGDSVTWTNRGAQPHSVSSDPGDPAPFDSSPSCPTTISNCIQPGGTFSFTFTASGTYAYHCKVHPTMQATVKVNGSGGTTTTSSTSTTSTTVAGGTTTTTVAGSTTTTAASNVQGSTTQTTAALATTGSQASHLLKIALATTLAGLVVVAAARRRRVED
jgi:plastocyanin